MALQLARTRACSSVCPAQRPIARCSLLGLRSLPSLSASSRASSNSRAVACRAQTEDRGAVEKRREPASGGQVEKADVPIWEQWWDAMVRATNWYQGLPLKQQTWFAAAIIGFLLLAPRAAVLVLVALERVLVGSLLATEAILASLLIRGSIFVGALALLGMVGWGIYAFVLDRRDERR